MSFEADEEILQDFLVEASEILEQLSEQLVDLEQSPDDKDLLNAIFRGFHTVKGGAGFLQIHALVDCCHISENIFDILRNGQRSVDADLMDVILEALDKINEMFDSIRAREEPEPADEDLLNRLRELAKPAGAAEPEPEPEPDPEPEPEPEVNTAQDSESDLITDDEFDQLLDDLDSKKQAQAPASSDAKQPESDEITDDEFESLLDELHGPVDSKKEEKTPVAKAQPAASEGEDLITDSEFEDLLDRLQAEGKGPATKKKEAAPEAAKPEKAEPAKAPAASKPAAAKKAPAKPKEPAKKAPPPPAAETSVRVDTKRLDDIMNMVGELVLVRNRLVRLGSESQNEAISKAVGNLDVVTGDLQTSVMKTRMQPIKKVFGRFPRVVRDLARQLKKEISLELVGEETDLDKNLVEALADPLVHLVRNSVDHGVEMPEDREKNGKDREGKIILSAAQEGDHIMLVIKDDGNGMDANKLRGIAVEKGLMDQDAADRLTDTECFNLIFAPGFSTKKEISDVSGRGVGMDVVKTKITQLNGTINIQSEMKVGTTISIKVPLTLAIMPTLMVMLKEQAFAFPLVNVNEIFHLDLTKTNVVDGQEVVVIREKAIPLFYLRNWLIEDHKVVNPDSSAHVVVFSVGNQRVGFVVDQLVGQEEVVIKPLGRMLQGTAGMAGATITGDGRIALILDVPSMLHHYAADAQESSAA